jgi:hypothetical protein
MAMQVMPFVQVRCRARPSPHRPPASAGALGEAHPAMPRPAQGLGRLAPDDASYSSSGPSTHWKPG